MIMFHVNLPGCLVFRRTLGAFGGDTGLELCEGVAWMLEDLEEKVGRKDWAFLNGELDQYLEVQDT